MPIGYQWISGYPENEEQQLKVYIYSNVVQFTLFNHFELEYEEMGESTRVRYDRLNKETTVEGNYIQVFRDDFKEFLMNRKCVLEWLGVFDTISDEVNTQPYDCIKSALKLSGKKLRVMEIQFEKFNAKQEIDILQFIEPIYFMRIRFGSADIDEASAFLRNWNQDCLLRVTFKRSTILAKDLMAVKKMLNYPTFEEIRFVYSERNQWSKERMMPFLKPFNYYSAFFRQHEIIFHLRNSLGNLIIAEEFDCLSLQDNRSFEVFTNPLLMKCILKETEWFDVQSLRKVSRDIRSCVDDLKPDPHVGEYLIKQIRSNKDNYPETIEAFILLKNLVRKRIWYRNREFPEYEDNFDVDDFVYCGDQLIERVVNDFEINMKHQKSKMKELRLESNGNLLELIGNVLKSINLSVHWLEMKVDNENDIMNILPHLTVDIILISSDSLLNLSNVAKLDQWRNAVQLAAEDCTIMNSIQELNLHNFEKIFIKVNSLSTNDVIYLKEIAKKCVKDICFTIHFNYRAIDANLYTSLPPYQRDFNSVWYFPMPIPEKFLAIVLSNQVNLIRFVSIDRDRVPEDFFNALI